MIRNAPGPPERMRKSLTVERRRDERRATATIRGYSACVTSSRRARSMRGGGTPKLFDLCAADLQRRKFLRSLRLPLGLRRFRFGNDHLATLRERARFDRPRFPIRSVYRLPNAGIVRAPPDREPPLRRRLAQLFKPARTLIAFRQRPF